MRAGRKSAAQTPAPKSERIYGSKVNKKGSASSKQSAKSIKLSSEIISSLKNKLNEFKSENSNSKINLNSLKAVYRRGLGAYSSSHRPTITGGKPNTRNAWAMARVNKFLKKASGEKVKAAYVQDDDLMAQGGEIKNQDVELKIYDTTPEHAKEYGLDAENPLFVQTLCVAENKRLKGIGNQTLKYIEDYAIRNEHDVIFGHITQKASFTKDSRESNLCDVDMIKNWLQSKGYSVRDSNNDFHKIVEKIDSTFTYEIGGL